MSRQIASSKTRTNLLVALSPALALTLFLGPGVNAIAAPSTTGSGESSPQTPSSYQTPSATELAAKQAEAARLAAQVADVQKALDEANANVAALQKKMDEATTAETDASVKAEQARAEEKTQKARLKAATDLVTQRRDDAGQYAAEVYRNGNYAGVEKMMSLLQSRNTDDMAQRMQMLDLVGRWRGSEVDTVEEARAVQADATKRAKDAADQAVKAETDAAAAKQSAQAALTEQTTQLMVINQLMVRFQSESATASAQAQALQQQMQQQMMSTTGASNFTNNSIVGQVSPSCPGQDLSGFSNGQIPTSALCPLWSAPGHYLRADAAYGFNQMSAAYAAQFGVPICITDSYRPYDVQVRLKAEKPHLAATPGKSNHGWARATDLCGGIQSFGTPQHVWMQQNAPKFGWCDPQWARAGGSKPEPWHWQYMDCIH